MIIYILGSKCIPTMVTLGAKNESTKEENHKKNNYDEQQVKMRWFHLNWELLKGQTGKLHTQFNYLT